MQRSPRIAHSWRQIAPLAAAMFVLGACEDSGVPSEPPRVVTVAEPVSAFATGFTAWSPAVNVEELPGTHAAFNSAAVDGCPFTSRDGKTFYMASSRAGGMGGLDIWVSTRSSVDDGWGEPVNAGAPVNSSADDFCPTVSRDGHLFYFVSRRSGGCGQGDIYVTRLRDDSGFDAPQLLPCDPSAPYEEVNSPFDEFSPFPLPEAGSGPVLYFSSLRPGGYAAEATGSAADSDVYWSASHGGVFGSAALVAGVNSTADDGQTNVRRDGLELFFYSTRVVAGSQGAADLYAANRSSVFGPWSAPVNLGPNVNSAGAETRPSLTWDGTLLYFGSTRAGGEGASDIYVSSRQGLSGGN